MLVNRLLLPFLVCALAAQHPPLTPTGNLTLDTTPTQGHFAFSYIDIPVGVWVKFTGAYPVQITCDGDAAIHGWLDVNGAFGVNGPGAVSTGSGQNGSYAPPGLGCGGLGGWFAPATDGTHAGVYGSALPFDLAGGSPGGSFTFHSPMVISCPVSSVVPGGGGGGTIVLECQGRLDVYAGGQITANGHDGISGSGSGSGGSILLRAFNGLTVHAGAQVLANDYAPGFVRLDAYGQAPNVLGTVLPAPLVLTLPHLAETQSPLLGGTWQLRVAAPRGDGVSLATSFAPGPTTTPWGLVGIDLPNAVLLAFLPMPATGHDPLATYSLALPNNPAFAGLNLYTAGFDWATPLLPTFTGTIHSIVQ